MSWMRVENSRFQLRRGCRREKSLQNADFLTTVTTVTTDTGRAGWVCALMPAGTEYWSNGVEECWKGKGVVRVLSAERRVRIAGCVGRGAGVRAGPRNRGN